MVDNRYATALVIGSVLSLLATVYLSVAVGTQHWFQYSSLPAKEIVNFTEIKYKFISGDFEEKTYSKDLYQYNGTLGLWWRCIQLPSHTHWFREPDDRHPDNDTGNRTQPPICTEDGCPDPKMETHCVSFTLPQQFKAKTKPPGDEDAEEDQLRTYLWRCQFLLPLVSLALVFLSGLVGVCACLCRSFTPTLVVGVLHFIAGLCSLATVCCFLVSVYLRHNNYAEDLKNVKGSLGWSLYLALISFPLQMMAAALFLWAARSHRKHYTRMTAYRIA